MIVYQRNIGVDKGLSSVRRVHSRAEDEILYLANLFMIVWAEWDIARDS